MIWIKIIAIQQADCKNLSVWLLRDTERGGAGFLFFFSYKVVGIVNFLFDRATNIAWNQRSKNPFFLTSTWNFPQESLVFLLCSKNMSEKSFVEVVISIGFYSTCALGESLWNCNYFWNSNLVSLPPRNKTLKRLSRLRCILFTVRKRK